jgi:hypothetical protein
MKLGMRGGFAIGEKDAPSAFSRCLTKEAADFFKRKRRLRGIRAGRARALTDRQVQLHGEKTLAQGAGSDFFASETEAANSN